jgi:hypothetical protein
MQVGGGGLILLLGQQGCLATVAAVRRGGGSHGHRLGLEQVHALRAAVAALLLWPDDREDLLLRAFGVGGAGVAGGRPCLGVAMANWARAWRYCRTIDPRCALIMPSMDQRYRSKRERSQTCPLLRRAMPPKTSLTCLSTSLGTQVATFHESVINKYQR